MSGSRIHNNNAAASGSDDGLTPLCHIVTPVGMLGCGFDESQTATALAKLTATNVPTALILDSGSTDSGPSKLALGCMSCPRSAYQRDLAKLLELVDAFRVPLIFSSAGGDGSDDHVREMLRVIEEIAAEERNDRYRFKTVAVFSGIDKTLVRARLHTDQIAGCGPCVPPLTAADVDGAATVVAQMGPEPFVDAMAAQPDFDVLVAGRAYDPAPYTAWATFLLSQCEKEKEGEGDEGGAIAGGFTHMGKIMECGGLCAQPKSPGAVATVYRSGAFDIAPLADGARCTPVSVAAHTLYEKSRPDVLHGPGGCLDVTGATYEQLADGRTVRVRGGAFRASRREGSPYRVKLEGATTVGWRTMFMGSVRDPILIEQRESLLERVKAYVAVQHRDSPGSWELGFHVYGVGSPEIFLVGEALASSQELATSVASTARIATTHGSYPGQKATSGNLAFGIGGKTEIELGECPQFTIYHLMDLRDGEERLRPARDAVNGHDDHAAIGIFSQSVSIIGKGSRPVRQPDIPPPPLPFDHAPVTTEPNGSAAPSHHAPATKPTSTTTTSFSPSSSTSSPTTLGQLARVLRSKNAGPYEITFDVMFSSDAVYRVVRDSGVLSAETAAAALGVEDLEDVVWAGFFDPARSFKITIPRVRQAKKAAAGGFMEDDVHGSQRHLGLVDMALSTSLLEGLARLEEQL